MSMRVSEALASAFARMRPSPSNVTVVEPPLRRDRRLRRALIRENVRIGYPRVGGVGTIVIRAVGRVGRVDLVAGRRVSTNRAVVLRRTASACAVRTPLSKASPALRIRELAMKSVYIGPASRIRNAKITTAIISSISVKPRSRSRNGKCHVHEPSLRVTQQMALVLPQ